MISRILDLLFIQVLRAWATGPDASPGWLSGAMDPVVGQSRQLDTRQPPPPLDRRKVGQQVNLSRSAFAERFARRVGQPPATYITEVRLASAADLLLETLESVGAIANKGSRSLTQVAEAVS